MDSVEFTVGLSHGVAWPWPIAVYLFLAGLSGGALAIVLALNFYRKTTVETPLLKAATCIGLVTIVLGMICLVLDLTDPLFFWRILVFYNPTSVMSLGVMALLMYIPLTFLLTLVVLRGMWAKCALTAWIEPIAELLAKVRQPICWLVLILAVTICAYTGFLISALIRYPLINTSVLPALFVASGLSAGAAASKLVAVLCFGDDRHGKDQHLLHAAEWPVMAAEALCIFMIAVGLINGGATAQSALTAFTCGAWALEFWIGVVLVGFTMPVVLNFLPGAKTSACVFFTSALCSVAGMMCLRLFILYAGQLNSL